MDFALTPEQEALRREIVELGRGELAPSPAGERGESFDRARWLACGRHRLQGLSVPEAHGGRGLDALSTAIALDALGYACEDGGLVFSLGAHLFACAGPIAAFGSEAQKRDWLPGLCDGTRIGAHAMTEPDAGSDAAALQTSAEPVGERFRLRGRKRFVTNGPVADVVVVFAVTDGRKGWLGGGTAFLLDTRRAGMTMTPPHAKLGLSGSPLGDLVLEDVIAGPDDVLGGVGAGAAVFAHAMSWERMGLFAAHVGAMQRLLERSVAQLRATRTPAARPADRALAHGVADRKMQLEAARLLVYQAAWKLARNEQVGLEASLAKLFVSEALVAAAEDAWAVEKAVAGLASPAADAALCDALASRIYSGTSEIQRNLIARWLGL
jgi:alkylation response protein AidB-like acyl-CoA dehydrogenase